MHPDPPSAATVDYGHSDLVIWVLRGIQLDLWMSIFDPSPILQIIPCFNNSKPCSMPLQAGEASAAKTVSKIFNLGSILPSRSWHISYLDFKEFSRLVLPVMLG